MLLKKNERAATHRVPFQNWYDVVIRLIMLLRRLDQLTEQQTNVDAICAPAIAALIAAVPSPDSAVPVAEEAN
ncbi:hypothetical protein [Schleiferilactobacillus shenzhenensis]|nr:hypothetical protein [Schleiferilactobacillus shenzhenensis]